MKNWVLAMILIGGLGTAVPHNKDALKLYDKKGERVGTVEHRRYDKWVIKDKTGKEIGTATWNNQRNRWDIKKR